MTKAETIFQKELNQIHDPKIKQFIIDCFDKLCPDYFWTCPCSTTGKYHPQVSLGIGGLVRHVKLAVWWGIELLRAMGEEPGLKDIPTLQDEVIATLLLHDLIKNGEGLGPDGRPLDRGVTGTHGVTLAEKISDEILNQGLNNSDIRILAGIALHMGIWTTKPYHTIDGPGVDNFIELIHLADYCASRKVDSIYSKLENDNDTNQQTTKQITEKSKDGTIQSSPCPGVRPTESQTTAEDTTG